MDFLDEEAFEDEKTRQEASEIPEIQNRQTSHEANVDLTDRQRRYRQVMDHAAESDAHVRVKWNEWEESIRRLTWSEVQ